MKTEEFMDETLEIMQEAYELAKRFKSPKINEFHIMDRLWRKLQPRICGSELESSFNRLEEYWFDSLARHKNATKDISISNRVDHIFQCATDIMVELEMKRLSPVHVLYGVLKADGKTSDALKKEGFTPAKIIMIMSDKPYG
tara:strand:+ start:384 stop:809 length:426 start_codon:yes stop_codon:yes gene_type:complete